MSMLQRSGAIDKITACGFLQSSGSAFLTNSEREQIVIELSKLIGNRDLVCDLGYVGEHAVAALVEVDSSFDIIRKVAYNPKCNKEELENLFNGIYEAITDIQCRSQRVCKKGLDFLLTAVRDLKDGRRLEAASAVELTTSEIGIAAADSAIEIRKLIDSTGHETAEELKTALGRINFDEAIEKLTTIRNELQRRS